jgi:hypothetical protein
MSYAERSSFYSSYRVVLNITSGTICFLIFLALPNEFVFILIE